jgi:hypothetical protein
MRGLVRNRERLNSMVSTCAPIYRRRGVVKKESEEDASVWSLNDSTGMVCSRRRSGRRSEREYASSSRSPCDPESTSAKVS